MAVREGYCERCETWIHALQCPKCGTILVPSTIAKGLLKIAKKIDEECNPSHPSISLVRQVYCALMDAYRLGAGGEVKKFGRKVTVNCEKESV